MIVMCIRGGLGNQLFQYATAYAQSKRNNTTLELDLTPFYRYEKREYQLKNLNIDYSKSYYVKAKNPIINRALRFIHIGRPFVMIKEKEENSNVFDPNAIKKRKLSTYYYGYWDHYKYFDEYRSDIIRQFKPNFKMSDSAMKLINILKNDSNSVAVHVRRGDYVGLKWCISMDYYREAIEKIKCINPNASFYFFSDDIEYVQNQFGSSSNYCYIDKSYNLKDLEEFFCMSSAHNQIIANSTFSWWAAYLNENSGRIIIAPENEHWNRDFYPDNWETIAVQ